MPLPHHCSTSTAWLECVRAGRLAWAPLAAGAGAAVPHYVICSVAAAAQPPRPAIQAALSGIEPTGPQRRRAPEDVRQLLTGSDDSGPGQDDVNL